MKKALNITLVPAHPKRVFPSESLKARIRSGHYVRGVRFIPGYKPPGGPASIPPGRTVFLGSSDASQLTATVK
jgi:hypothetical protein